MVTASSNILVGLLKKTALRAFSLAERRSFGPDGFVFRSHLDGEKRALSPEVAMTVQGALGADIAMQAAPLVLMSNSLGAVAETLDVARRAFTIVRQNLFWAFAYNVAGITLAAIGILNPILAAGAMVLSSFSVIANSRRLT